jgi:large-conductance mechanosensitive channel
LINYKWDELAYKHHKYGAVIHFAYIGLMIFYVIKVYMHDEYGHQHESEEEEAEYIE